MMIDTSIIIPTNECTKGNFQILPPLASSVCTIFCLFAMNGGQIEFPKQNIFDVCVVSTGTAKWEMYNSGNINFCMDGVPTMDEGLLQSYRKISEIERLSDDWNGNGASSFSADLLNSVRNIVKKLDYQPRIFPTARESIQFEYENDDGNYLEFELYESGRIKKFYYGHDGKTETEDISEEMIYEVVKEFYGFKFQQK